MFKLSGVIPPMITPFDQFGNLDELQLVSLIQYLKQHVQGLFICGSYGCGPMMSLSERKLVAEITVKTVNKSIPVIVHVGTTNTRDTVDLAKHARDIGCDAIAAVGPYYYTHSENDIFHFYSDILTAVGPEFPVYLYNNPKFQGYEINISTIQMLKEIGLYGVKDATFNIMTYAKYCQEFGYSDFDIVLGTEAMWLSARAFGCQAFIPGLGNAFPELCVRMWNEGMKNDFSKCKETQFLINKIRSLMYIAGSTQQAVYCMASIRGIIHSYPRSPFTPASQEDAMRLREELKKIGVL